MSVADIGAGEGYYTVRLSPMVGRKGRVLAEDIVPATIQRARPARPARAARQCRAQARPAQRPAASRRLVRPGLHDPHVSRDRAAQRVPVAPARRRSRATAAIIVVDADRPTDHHGTPPQLLVCEFNAVGYELNQVRAAARSRILFRLVRTARPRAAAQRNSDLRAIDPPRHGEGDRQRSRGGGAGTESEQPLHRLPSAAGPPPRTGEDLG